MSIESKQDGRPRKKKKKKEKSGPGLALWLGIGGGGLLVVLIAVGVVVARPWEWGSAKKEVAQNNPQPVQPQPPPPRPDGNVVKNPKSLLGNIRNRVNMTERDNEMRQIFLFFTQYADIAKNPASRTVDGFLESFKRDSNLIYAKINTDNLYTVNVRARVDSQDILAFESEAYTDGYYCVHANNQLGFVSPQDMKAAGLIAP